MSKIRVHLQFIAILLIATAAGAAAPQPPARAASEKITVDEIAALLPEAPTAFGRKISDRAAWAPIAQSAAGRAVIQEAEKLLTTPLPEQPDELFLEYTRIGNRTNWEGVAFARRERIKTLVEAECLENKGRFLPELEKTIRALAAEHTWVFPAHDGGLGNFKGTGVTIDLFSSGLAWSLSDADWLLGDKLSPEVRKLIRAKAQAWIFTPYRRMLAGEQSPYWLANPNNWSAVCLAGVTGTALALIESRQERARYIKAAMDFSWVFLGGFTPDGYCSEGVGYWNYGFGRYVLLAEEIRLATGGKIDLLARAEARAPATFGARIQIAGGVCPAFADCAVDARPDADMVDFLNRRLGFGLPAYKAEGLEAGKGYIVDDMMYRFTVADPVAGARAETAKLDIGLRSWFEKAGILIARPAAGAACRLGVALKGGNNAEHHNHNDVGSYVVALGSRAVLLDPGPEVYTARTFSGKRYESKLLNSWGHAVPVVAGKLQREGAQARGVVLKAEFSEAQDTLALEIKSAYAVESLKTLTRTFVYSRGGAGILTVKDEAEFAKPETFETALVTLGEWKQTGAATLEVRDGGETVKVAIDAGGEAFELVSEAIKEAPKTKIAGGIQPKRIGIRLTRPVARARVEIRVAP